MEGRVYTTSAISNIADARGCASESLLQVERLMQIDLRSNYNQTHTSKQTRLQPMLLVVYSNIAPSFALSPVFAFYQLALDVRIRQPIVPQQAVCVCVCVAVQVTSLQPPSQTHSLRRYSRHDIRVIIRCISSE